MQHAVRRFGRVHKFQDSLTVAHSRASASGGGAGSKQDAGTTLITTTIRHAHNARGVSAIPTTRANTATSTRIPANATARSNASATTGDARA
ncbi:MAG: hypothetical protein A3F74_15050 [Betaproteobacteria bacterium RIFCSPLOWO2_12_FULL_62_58]|nr:MAG: hypothetical protein A3I62_02070 [Betaproteobacteria bacterium RIFCSPLOWO2_02_FULL_62_79]OGA52762.1 MAG: hypothetical protein A3F74_15050 [Betaproteobacteria bacterium RIFCSPLOWO2_12_FULL_62_58]